MLKEKTNKQTKNNLKLIKILDKSIEEGKSLSPDLCLEIGVECYYANKTWEKGVRRKASIPGIQFSVCVLQGCAVMNMSSYYAFWKQDREDMLHVTMDPSHFAFSFRDSRSKYLTCCTFSPLLTSLWRTRAYLKWVSGHLVITPEIAFRTLLPFKE